jgi:hypothetical protein
VIETWSEFEGISDKVYWREDPDNKGARWHVSRNRANTFGSVAGQVLPADGWYWWTMDFKDNRASSMVGPFPSAAAAIADCESAMKQKREAVATLADPRIQNALTFIRKFGDTDGGHHKQWALDQVVRILTGTSDGYEEWVRETMAGEDGPMTYGWDQGIAP